MVSFIGAGNQSTRRMLYRVHLTFVCFDLKTLVVINTDGIGSCKFNYRTITTMMVPPV